MKSLNKTAMSLAVLAALATPGMAAAEAKIFGKAHLSFGSTSEDDGTTDESSNSVTSHASRVGIKGSVDTESGVKVVYRFAWQIDMSDDSKSSDDHIKSREQFVGLKGDFGEVRLGRDDSPYKKAGKKNVEHLSDTWADFNNIIDKGQDTRNDNSVGYWNKIGPGKLGLQYAAGDDDASADNAGESMSFAYDIKMGNIGFAVAYQTIEEAEDNDEEGTKVSFGYKLGSTKLGLMYETVEDDEDLDDKNMFFSVKHGISKKAALVLAYGVKDQDLDDDATMTALSYQYKLDKKVSVYGLFADGADGGLDDASKLAGDGQAIVAGLVAKF